MFTYICIVCIYHSFDMRSMKQQNKDESTSCAHPQPTNQIGSHLPLLDVISVTASANSVHTESCMQPRHTLIITSGSEQENSQIARVFVW